jgi:hypothetical protein
LSRTFEPSGNHNEKSFLKNVTLASLAALLSVTMTGCSVPRPNFSVNQNEYKTVAVISLLPQTITMSHIGFTVFQNDFATYPLDWDLNAFAVQATESFLSQHYQTRNLNVNTGAIMADVQQKYTLLDAGDTSGLVSAQLQAQLSPGLVDLIVVIDASAAGHASDIGGSGGFAPNHGLSSYNIATGQDVVSLDATFEVFDGTTFKLLAFCPGGPPDIDGTGKAPTDRASGLNWRGQSLDSFSTEQRQNLKTAEQNAIQDFITAAMPFVQLTSH